MKSRYALVFVMAAAACLNACGHELLETEIDDGCKLHTVKCNGLTRFVCTANESLDSLECKENVLQCQSENYTGKTRWKLAQEPCECFDGQISYENIVDENGNELCHEVTCTFGKSVVSEKPFDGSSCLNVQGTLRPGGQCVNNVSRCSDDKFRICVNGLYKEIECEGCSENSEDGVYSCTVKRCENENKPFCSDNLLKICENTEKDNASFQITITPCKEGCVPGNEEHEAFCKTTTSECKDGDVDDVNNKVCQNGEWVACSLGIINHSECRDCMEGDITCDGKSLKICDNGHWTIHSCAEECVSSAAENALQFEMCVAADSECAENTVVCDDGMLKKCENKHWIYIKCGKGCIDNDKASYCKECDDTDVPKCIEKTDVESVEISENYIGSMRLEIESVSRGNTVQVCSVGHWVDKRCKSGCYGSFNEAGNGSVTCIDAKGDSEEKLCTTVDGQASMCIPSENKLVTCLDDDVTTSNSINYYAMTYCQLGCYSTLDKVGCGECLSGKEICQDNKKSKCEGGHWVLTDENCEPCTDTETVCKNDYLFTCDEGIFDEGKPCEIGCLDDKVCKKCDTNEYPKCDESNSKKLTCDNGLNVIEEICENGCLNGECRQCKTDGETMCDGKTKLECLDGKWTQISVVDDSDCGECQNGAQKCHGGIESQCIDGEWKTKQCGEGLGCMNGTRCRDCNKSVCADDWSVRLCDNGTWNETIKPCEYGCTDGMCNQTAKCDYMCIRGTINKCSDNDYESLNVTQYCDDETNKTYICSDSGIKIIDCSPSGCDETHSNCKNEPCITGNSKCMKGNYYYCENSEWLSLPFAKDCCNNNMVTNASFYQPAYCNKEGNNCSPSQDHCFNISCNDGYVSSPNDNNNSCKLDGGKYSYGECQNGTFETHENGTHIHLCFNGVAGLFVKCPDGFTRTSSITGSNLFLSSDSVCEPKSYINNYCHNVSGFYEDEDGIVGVDSKGDRCVYNGNPVSCHYYLENDNSVLKSECGKCINYEISGTQICINGEWVDDWILNKNN